MRRLSLLLAATGLRVDSGDWLVAESVLACAYPRRNGSLPALTDQGIKVLVNLHHKHSHDPALLERYGLAEIRVPMEDFKAPTPEQLDRAVRAIEAALAANQPVAVHCGGGLGRTGTVLACYLVRRGLTADAAIAQVRALRPGSVETRSQEAAIAAFAQRHRLPTSDSANGQEGVSDMRRMDAALSYRSPLTHRAQRDRLNAAGPYQWIDRDSHWYPDYISTRCYPNYGFFKIFDEGDGRFTLSIKLVTDAEIAEEVLTKLKEQARELVLAVIDAEDVQPAEPYD